ncbi:hypothetical protein B2J93_2002 [Marssonina coronariae]|uniref:Uncharacterized protein n=1 Tax=Diplocarpon coronariae TaxID=2795749 RepID=A0A218ZGP6_9HELO|nr:hypothetical protein B2J93_2002 [Marssonina coronariae]
MSLYFIPPQPQSGIARPRRIDSYSTRAELLCMAQGGAEAESRLSSPSSARISSSAPHSPQSRGTSTCASWHLTARQQQGILPQDPAHVAGPGATANIAFDRGWPFGFASPSPLPDSSPGASR